MPPDYPQDPTSRIAPRPSMRIWSLDLLVVDGPSRGSRATVSSGTARVGAADGNDLTIADPTVSRVHCELVARAGAITLRDLGSTNGTFVEGVRVRDAEVPPGAVVRVGASAFRVDVGQEPAFVELSARDSFGELVGSSLEMRRLYAALERLAPTDTTLLVEGETGTGKDVLARSLHAASTRAAGAFVAVDCGAIPENLVESELFGHVRGAFTGAVGDRKGVFEEAHGGTLFLDEIGEMPIAMQPKLLRAIESRSVRRVGAATSRPVDVRIVAATNRSLARCVNEGTFREDLYYRLAVVTLSMPPLRTRREDIPVLARHFHRAISGADAAELPPEFLARLMGRSWPGNVRELRNFVERSVSLGLIDERSPATSSAAAAPPSSNEGPDISAMLAMRLPLKEARAAWIESFESIYVRDVLRQCGGNVTRAAERAGVSRRFLQRMIARLGIKPSEVGGSERDFTGDDD
ncbi:MAG TPA: sigma 54-interacting transcriptional regulator [Polyangiaceae bacterium]|nr:sigma 54-interacting transcriptional regulator [Polyangiaceae bacterium]